MIASVATPPGLDVLVNSASAYQAGTISDMTPAQLDRLWNQLHGAVFSDEGILQKDCRGSIVNIWTTR
jgi:predicted TIM-barrel enzyme